jgi:hypothetical protein
VYSTFSDYSSRCWAFSKAPGFQEHMRNDSRVPDYCTHSENAHTRDEADMLIILPFPWPIIPGTLRRPGPSKARASAHSESCTRVNFTSKYSKGLEPFT